MFNLKKIKVYLMLIAAMLFISACGKNGGSVKDVSLTEVHEAVKAAYGESYRPNMPYESTTLKEIFGLSEDMYDEVIAEGPMMSFSIDTFVAVKAKSGQADAVEKALNSYRDYLINDSFQYPSNIAKVQGSVVKKYGDNIFFILLGDIPTENEEQGEEAIIKAAKEQNQIAVDVLDGLFK